ncbi:unnamed protein product [Ambrosiozyma monospora]|uniref:Unnamed protein product n=1 Tax=Ambrosiozyma monospora TaxID=43982 RepID=A0ACB5U834_AMBMO|nr:unnamed protein product [Ambrosiozyma monospora]
MSPVELTHVKNFKVGRTGFGEIEFLKPIDLTSISIASIPDLIVFTNQSCIVYPDDSSKPKMGDGFNVPSQITIENTFPVSKDTKQPITDPHHPVFRKFVRKLHHIPKTTFKSYDPSNGAWTFIAEHA